jgi:hypothetical protein
VNESFSSLFNRAVDKHSELETLGVREIFSINNEIQSDGKSFKKVRKLKEMKVINFCFHSKYDLGNYKWQTYKTIHERAINLSNGLLSTGKSVSNGIPTVDFIII